MYKKTLKILNSKLEHKKSNEIFDFSKQKSYLIKTNLIKKALKKVIKIRKTRSYN